MIKQLKNLIRDEEAPTAVEYALMVACVAVAIIGGAVLLGGNTNAKFNQMAGQVANPVAPAAH